MMSLPTGHHKLPPQAEIPRAILVAVTLSCFVVEGKAVTQNAPPQSADLANRKAELISSTNLFYEVTLRFHLGGIDSAWCA
jgi:hypothetical protein